MKVYVQLQPHSRDWKPATVTECLDYNRYKVQIDFNGKEYTRNLIYIKPRKISQEDPEGQSGNQADTRTITHRLWIHQS